MRARGNAARHRCRRGIESAQLVGLGHSLSVGPKAESAAQTWHLAGPKGRGISELLRGPILSFRRRSAGEPSPRPRSCDRPPSAPVGRLPDSPAAAVFPAAFFEVACGSILCSETKTRTLF